MGLSHDQHLLLTSFSSETTHVSPRESYSPTSRLTLCYCLILQFKWSSVSSGETFALCIPTCLLLSGSKTSRLVVVISLGLQLNLIINVLKPTEGLQVRRQSGGATRPPVLLCNLHVTGRAEIAHCFVKSSALNGQGDQAHSCRQTSASPLFSQSLDVSEGQVLSTEPLTIPGPHPGTPRSWSPGPCSIPQGNHLSLPQSPGPCQSSAVPGPHRCGQ